MEVLVKSFKKAVELGNIPDGWKESRTMRIPKNIKPKVTELRPIVLTHIGYKLMMAVIGNNLGHIIINNSGKNTQAGFTEGSRI